MSDPLGTAGTTSNLKIVFQNKYSLMNSKNSNKILLSDIIIIYLFICSAS